MLTYDQFHPTFAEREEWTIPHVLQARARSHPSEVFLDAPESATQLTYAETLDAVHRIASGLIAQGHEPGDRMVIMLDNRVEYILAWLGSSFASMAEVPMNTAYRGSFLEHQVRTVAPTAVVVSPDYAALFIDSRDACESVRVVYVVSDGADETVAAQQAIADLTAAGYRALPFAELTVALPLPALPTPSPRDLAAVFFTSGTTGLSKGVAMSHSQLYFFADEGVSLVRLKESDVYLAVGPLFHGNAQFLSVYPSMIVGARLVLRRKFSASRWTTWVRESSVTVTNLVGVMSDFLWKQPCDPRDNENVLRCVWAVPNPTTVAAEFKRRFGIEELVENFGLTEISMPILTPYGMPRPAGAAGLAVSDWFDVRLVDPVTDEEVPIGAVGELAVRPKVPWTISNGYFGMPERTVEATRNCWFHTGDGLRRDEAGWYYFVDRLKDAIRRRGENISSYEVEQAVLTHQEIAECAVIGVPADGAAAEDEVLAVVVLRSGATLEAADLWSFFDTALPRFAVPRYLRFSSTLPTTPSGKVRKGELRALGTKGALDRELAAASPSAIG